MPNDEPIIALHTVPTPTVTISPSGPIQGAVVGSPQVINCTVSTVSGVESSLVMISWTGPGGNIDATDGRVSIGSVTGGGNNMYTRSLLFDYLMEGDEGSYTCHVMILATSVSQLVALESLISKLSLTYCNIPSVGFGCEVLICVNYASCHGLTNFNSAVTLALSFQQHLSQFR